MSDIYKYKTLIDSIMSKATEDNKGITFIMSDNEEIFLSYRNLYNHSLRILKTLQDIGIRQTSELVFQIEDNMEFILLFWACILGGIIPVPIAVGNNDEHRLKLFKVIRTLKNPYLAVDIKTLNKLDQFSKENNLYDEYEHIKQTLITWDNINDLDNKNNGKICSCAPSDIAFIQFSSGSTGDPKGVTLTHENLLTNIRAIIKCSEFHPLDSLLSWMPLTHDLGIIGCHLTPLVFNINQFNIPTALFIRRPILWLKKASEHKSTILQSPNFGYKYLLSFFKPEIAKDWDLSHVRLIFNGAEPISLALCNEFLDKMEFFGLKKNSMFTVYGLAEASLAVTFPGVNEKIISWNLDRKHLAVGSKVQVLENNQDENCVTFVDEGFPVENCSVRICSQKGVPVDDYIVGYINIKGKNVTSGYYNNPQATRSTISEDGWLNTGDLGFMSKGRLVVTGREKDIIFINGQNYYPHDLERTAQELDEIELGHVAACGVFNPVEQKEDVIIFVLFKKPLEEFVPLCSKLKKLISRKIGIDVKEVIPVRKIPKTTSGKIQRYKLGAMYANKEFSELSNDLSDLLHEYKLNEKTEAPENEVEKILVLLWKEVLSLDTVGINESFFELGGHSLRAATLAAKIRQHFNIVIETGEIFSNSTVKKLSDYISSKQKNSLSIIPKAEERNFYPLSSSQSRMYILQELDKENTSYNIPWAILIEGVVDKKKISNAFRQLVDRHESLRTSFKVIDGEPVQIVHKSIDFSVVNITASKNNLDSVITSFIKSFDLTKPPLIRVLLVELDNNKHVLFCDIHHIVLDGVSGSILAKEFLALYKGNVLPQLRLQYKDFAVWEKECFIKESLMKNQEEYWLNVLSELPPSLNLPFDFSRLVGQDFEGDRIIFYSNTTLYTNIKKLLLEAETTLYMVILCSFNILLSRYCSQDDILVGSSLAARPSPELENVIGMFVNNIVMRNKPKGNKKLWNFLQEVKANSLDAYKNQYYPFDLLVEKLAVNRVAGENPLFNVLCEVYNMESTDIQIDNLKITPYTFENKTSKFDLTLEATEKDRNIEFVFEYRTSLFKKETIERMSRDFISILHSITTNINVCIGDVELENEISLLDDVSMEEIDFCI